MRILNRYIRRQVMMQTGLVLLVLIGVESFMELVSQMSVIGVGHYSLLIALLTVPMQLPTDLYQLFPMAGFLGCILGLGRLASSSELMVMRASGVSIKQISWSVIKAAIVMIILVTVIGEWAAPALLNKATQVKDRALGHAEKLQAIQGVWLHQGNRFITVNRVADNTLKAIQVYRFAPNNRLLSLTTAQKGVQKKGHWILQDVDITTFMSDRVVTRHRSTQPIHLLLKPKLLKQTRKDTDQDSVIGILKNIVYRKRSGLTASQFEFSFWQRMLQPITTIIMICLGIPFIFGSLRTSSTGTRVLMGILVGFSFYMMNRFFGPISMLYQVPALFAAAAPTVLFVFIYLVLLKRVR